jgi:DNA-directed RNA polymerase subunit RPC12/RpoP
MDKSNNTSDNDDGILIEVQKVEGFKCGYCGENLIVKVFFKDDKYYRKISCPNCMYNVSASERQYP